MGFADVAQQALQPSILGLDPGFARGLLVRDLNRVGGSAAALRSREDQRGRAAFSASERERTSGKHGFGFLRPHALTPRYKPAGNQSQYMIDALLKQASLDEYDRRAPPLRQDLARAQP